MIPLQTVADVMTAEPIVLDAAATVTDAARAMKARNVGDVLVRRDGKLCGIVTDRDIVVRVLAENPDGVASRPLADFCSTELECLAPDAPIGAAVELMEAKAIRRIPIVENGRPLGIVSLGDLALLRDRTSALARISAAPPSR
jgi:signal-transduction protein with cAMP-binding, CBS, and nucleotidyltransferase domain